MRLIHRWLQRQYEKVRARGPKSAPDARYQDVPQAARITNPLSNRAAFASCVYRRRGYIAQVAVSEFVALLPAWQQAVPDGDVMFEREQELMNAWVRGVIWPPLLCLAAVENGRWVLRSCRDAEIALFLDGRQQLLNIQFLVSNDPPADKGKLALLQAGLFTPSGKRCPVVFARATY